MELLISLQFEELTLKKVITVIFKMTTVFNRTAGFWWIDDPQKQSTREN